VREVRVDGGGRHAATTSLGGLCKSLTNPVGGRGVRGKGEIGDWQRKGEGAT